LNKGERHAKRRAQGNQETAALIPIKLDALALKAGGKLPEAAAAPVAGQICIDSRSASPRSVFVALKGERTDGHLFLEEAFKKGAVAAIVSEEKFGSLAPNADRPLIAVPSPLHALQLLAKWQRTEYIKQVLAITGSSGKTAVKDALKQILRGRQVSFSPGSYNSKLGLPLALLSAEQPVPLAVLELGISAPGDMAILEEIATPDFGLLTNVGTAHLASFGNRESIAREKMKLFERIPEDGWVLLPYNEPLITRLAQKLRCKVRWAGGGDEQILSLETLSPVENGLLLGLRTSSGESAEVRARTRSPGIVCDLHLAASAAYLLGVSLEGIAAALEDYRPSPTRIELWTTPEGIRIVNDAYSADPISVQAALRSAASAAQISGKKIFAFSGMRELGTESAGMHGLAGVQAAECGFGHLFLAGNGEFGATAEQYQAMKPDGAVVRVATPSELKDRLLPILRSGDTVLFKGPPNSGMSQAARDLAGSAAQRCLWVDLGAISENLDRFRRHCGTGTGLLVMLKALAYGTELVQLASWLSRTGIADIGVSSASEGAAIRKNGIDESANIYVFLAHHDDIPNLCHYNLVPVLHSAGQIETFAGVLDETGQRLDVHLKIDSGMHRLGIAPDMAVSLARRIASSAGMRLTGVCTHFAAADDPASDDDTRQQIAVFSKAVEALKASGFKNLEVHAANTAAAVRFPQARFDMVRVGIGLYGLYTSPSVARELPLELGIAVTSQIASLRDYEAGNSLGYSRAYTTGSRRTVGVIPFGYADGLPWSLSGKGHVMVDGQCAPILGRISMDQALIDLTGIPGAYVGAEVLIYGARNGYCLRPEEVAKLAGTIPHELLVRLGRRVHRVYVEP
jgi:Alr-MurF fusion protein